LVASVSIRQMNTPPMTCKDNRQKENKSTNQPTAQPKIINRSKDVIDLTNETTMTTTMTTMTLTTARTTTATTKSQTILIKYGINIGDRLLPVVKRQTVLIPSCRNIINFQNITNNYLKVNKRMGQIVTPNPCNSMKPFKASRISRRMRIPSPRGTKCP